MRILLACCAAVSLSGQVPYQRILNAGSEADSWLTYSGTYQAQRYSTLDRINRTNAGRLKTAWMYQVRAHHKFETSPLVFDGMMYISEPPSDVTALDLRTGRPVWSYRRTVPAGIPLCCGHVNRGVAALDVRGNGTAIRRNGAAAAIAVQPGLGRYLRNNGPLNT